MPFAILASLALAVIEPWDATEPALVPSGMDLLYSDRIAFKPSGEPIITLGIVAGRERVALRSTVAIQADFYEAGTLKRATVRGGDAIDISIVRAQPATRRTYVDLEGVPWAANDKLDWTLATWRARGYAAVEALEEGTVVGIGGRVIDNRELRVVLPVADAQKAKIVIDEIYRRFGIRPSASARLSERPWGELKVKGTTAPLGIATSFVRFVAPGGTIQVDGVEHAKGYAWHGFENRQYAGEIYVVVDPDGRLAVVNVLGAEQVLAGVVPAEIYTSSPAEALKAQAVAARNQLFAKLGKRHHDDPFHLCGEQHCQVYAGTNKEDARTTDAVLATTGELAFLKGKLVDTVYSSSCGGHTEDNESVWGNRPDPALRADLTSRSRAKTTRTLRRSRTASPTTSCRAGLREGLPPSADKPPRPTRTSSAGRRATAPLSSTPSLPNGYASILPLNHLETIARGKGGRIESLRLIGDKGEATVLHELNIRRLFGNLNSGAFIIDEVRDDKGKLVSVTFTGGGWGHGVGMCQVGAVGRAEAGHDYRRIVAHYYNGATIERLYGEPAPGPEISAAP